MFRKITRRNLDMFLNKYRSDKRVLDVGAGGSAYSKFFPNRITVDIDPGRKPDVIGDAHALPFKDDEFEIVLYTEVLEHLKDPPRAIKEMRRVLKKDGLVILTTRFVYPLHDVPGDYWRFTKYGLASLFDGWEIVTIEPETAAFSTIAVLLQRIVFQTRLRANKITKLFLLLLAYILDKLNFLVVKEYGDIKKSKTENHIMPSGYYLVARKK